MAQLVDDTYNAELSSDYIRLKLDPSLKEEMINKYFKYK